MIILSIIIPVYNVEKYVRKTLESIFESNFPKSELEVIVVNDGTKDNSMSIVYEFAAKFDNLKIINQENQGLSVARNTGLKAARGKYVWFVDSDDWIEKGFLEKIIPLLSNYDNNVYMMLMRMINEGNFAEHISPFPNMKHQMSIEGYKAIWLDARDVVKITPIQRYIISRRFILENNLLFVPGIYHEDVEFAPRMLICTDRITLIPIVGYCYLLRISGSITTDQAKQSKRNMSRVRILDNFQKLESRLPDKNKRNAIRFSEYKVMTYLFNESSLDSFYYFVKSIGFGDWKCKKLVVDHLFYDHKIMHLGRQILFLLSPKLLKLFNKML